MTKEEKVKVLDLMEIYYHDRNSLNKKQEKELIDFVDELKTAIEVIRCSTELPYNDTEIRGLLDKLVEDHYSNRPEKSTFALGFITCYNMLKVKQERNEAIT